jgi:hypothetical protein
VGQLVGGELLRAALADLAGGELPDRGHHVPRGAGFQSADPGACTTLRSEERHIFVYIFELLLPDLDASDPSPPSRTRGRFSEAAASMTTPPRPTR